MLIRVRVAQQQEDMQDKRMSHRLALTQCTAHTYSIQYTVYSIQYVVYGVMWGGVVVGVGVAVGRVGLGGQCVPRSVPRCIPRWVPQYVPLRTDGYLNYGQTVGDTSKRHKPKHAKRGVALSDDAYRDAPQCVPMTTVIAAKWLEIPTKVIKHTPPKLESLYPMSIFLMHTAMRTNTYRCVP